MPYCTDVMLYFRDRASALATRMPKYVLQLAIVVPPTVNIDGTSR